MIDEQATRVIFGYYSTNLTSGSHSKIIAVCDICGMRKEIEYRVYNLNPIACKYCYGHSHDIFIDNINSPIDEEQTKRDIGCYSKYLMSNSNKIITIICPSCKQSRKIKYQSFNNAKDTSGLCKTCRMATDDTRKQISNSHANVSGINNPMYGIRMCKTDNHFYGKTHTKDTRIKISTGLTGISVEDWKEFAIEYPPEFNETLKSTIRNMYDNKCFACNCTSKIALSVHHIDRDKSNNSIQNLIPLCSTCHGHAHNSYYQAIYTYIKLYEKLEDSDET